MASKVKLQNLSVDDLIDQFDSIPEMMSSLNANMSSPRRYSCKSLLSQCFAPGYHRRPPSLHFRS